MWDHIHPSFTFKQAKRHVGQLSKLQTLLHMFMWCHFNVMSVVGSDVKY
jgi:hypothetical protein